MYSSRIQEKVKDDYNEIASDFANSRRFPWADFDIFLKYYNSDASVLDLGCGNGRLLTFLKKHGYGKYLGVDQSDKLLEIAKADFDEEFLLADISELKLEKKFDYIFVIASFHHLPPKDQLKSLQKWKTLLKKDGYLFMTNWNLQQKKYFLLFLKSLILPSYGMRGVMVPWQNKIKRYYFAFNKKRLQKLLAKAGFKLLYNEYVNNGKEAGIFKAKNIVTIAKNENN